ncbi:CPBP family intramembrane glutamic endopeptidase [Clostridium guangxiense]|uniref:CPBP family intramembrane glutamic endopeptidase n=2 Tax=Clostridium TaxID=1485 RepID=UPI001E2B6443|nr:CPBP family intramembrane glutamic endopeptidase [Clostridium guangxiense]MCD2347280.1 CPBP family intramembrane metalloprotease [Clostridium guangxiense]
MIEIIVDIFIIIFIYVFPIVIFIKYFSKTKHNKYMNFLYIVIYAVGVIITSNFMDNLFPFIFIILSILILKNNIDENDYDKYSFSIRRVNIIKAAEYFIVFYTMNIVAAFIFQWIFLKFNIDVQQQEVVSDMEKMKLLSIIKYIPVSVIFAPILEEFIFRFILFEKILKGKIGLYASCIVSSMLFSTLHYNLKALPVLFILAVENCYLIHKKGFWYSVLNHSLFNFITVAAILSDKIK